MNDSEKFVFTQKLKVSKLPPIRVIKCVRKFEGKYADEMPPFGFIMEEVFNNRGNFINTNAGLNFGLSIPLGYERSDGTKFCGIEAGWYEIIEHKKVKDSLAFKKQVNDILENRGGKGRFVRWGQESFT